MSDVEQQDGSQKCWSLGEFIVGTTCTIMCVYITIMSYVVSAKECLHSRFPVEYVME